MNIRKQIALIVTLSSFAGAALAAEAPARRTSRAPKQDKCAEYGEGFIYEPSTGSCIRVGGVVGAQVNGGTPRNGAQ